MAPTRMKLRVRRRENAAAAGSAEPEEEEEERSRESGGRSSRRKITTSTPAAASSASPPPASSSSSSSVRAVVAAEEASPDSKCPICLDRFNNLAYLDRCLHRFCFPCIQEWSHNKAECPLCKQPFTSILHSVRAEDDFQEYTLRPPPVNSSVAATVAMVAAMASAARSDHQMRLMLRRHRGADGSETRRRRRERGGRVGRRSGVWEWYLDSHPVTLLPPHAAYSPVVNEEGEEEQRRRGGADLPERGVIFEGLTGLGGGVTPVAPNDRASRRLMTRLVARQRLQREGGAVRRLRERETVAFRRALYRSGIRVRGVTGPNEQQRDITAESFRRSPTHLNRLRPWLRRELTVLYGAHGSLVDIVQRIIMARLARHGLEDTPTIEEELRPFLLARTDHFLHELVSFARSPLGLESYDLQAVYEPPTAALELDGTSSSSDGSSVIAISEGEEDEERRAAGPSEEQLATHDDIQAGSCLSMAAWDDETPGPSYSSAEPPCSLSSPPLSPAPANEEAGEKEEECLIVGYKKPIAERTPELVQLSSDSEEDEEKKEEKEDKELPPLPAAAPPLSYSPLIPPSTSGACSEEAPKEKDGEHHSCSWSCSSRNSVCTLSPATPAERDRKSDSEEVRERRKKKKKKKEKKRRRERSGTLFNPNRSIYPAMMRHRSHSPSPFHSSVESSPPDSCWEYHCSHMSRLTSSPSSSSSSSSPQASTAPSLSPSNHGEKPGGKRKYKSRHLDSDDKDPTWRPSSSREKRGEERRRRGREDGRKRESSSSRRSREERSPSVEIIYEGTITSNAAHPPARKRRRKHRRKTPHSSSPVIITLDSDSSLDANISKNNISSSSSSPISSQQTVDFSDLPPLPLVHSAGVGGALNTEIGELPVDILDRGSDLSEAEPAGPIAINSDVDVENIAEGSDEDKGPIRTADLKLTEDDDAALTTNLARKRKSTSDSRLLASILNDLKGIAAPKFPSSLNFEPSCSPDARKKRFSDEDILDENRDFDFPLHRNAIRPLPSLERLKDKDVPPLLKQASPVRSYNRNTPPPLKHKDAGSPHLSPISPIDLHSNLNPNPVVDIPKDNRAIPPISTMKKHFTNAVASTSSISPIDSLSSAPSKVGELPAGVHSTNHKPPIDLHSSSENSSTSADCLSHLEFNYFHSAKEISSSTIDVHPVNSSSHIDFHTTKTGWSTDGSNFRQVSPIDLHPTSSFSAGGADVYSGVNCNDKSPPGAPSSSFSPIDMHYFSKKENFLERLSTSRVSSVPTTAPSGSFSPIVMHPTSPKSTIDFHSSSKRENFSERLSSSRISSVPSTAPSGRLSPIDVHPKSPKSTVDFHSFGATSKAPTDNKTSSLANHGDRSPHGRLPPIDLHCTRPVSPVNAHSSSSHLNHRALTSASFRTSPKNCSFQSESHSKPHNHFDANAQFPIDSHPENPRRDFHLPTENHITSSVEKQWNSNSIDAHSNSHSAT